MSTPVQNEIVKIKEVSQVKLLSFVGQVFNSSDLAVTPPWDKCSILQAKLSPLHGSVKIVQAKLSPFVGQVLDF